jgi:hypothetical protein
MAINFAAARRREKPSFSTAATSRSGSVEYGLPILGFRSRKYLESEPCRSANPKSSGFQFIPF